jgi:hypothetical protein
MHYRCLWSVHYRCMWSVHYRCLWSVHYRCLWSRALPASVIPFITRVCDPCITDVCDPVHYQCLWSRALPVSVIRVLPVSVIPCITGSCDPIYYRCLWSVHHRCLWSCALPIPGMAYITGIVISCITASCDPVHFRCLWSRALWVHFTQFITGFRFLVSHILPVLWSHALPVPLIPCVTDLHNYVHYQFPWSRVLPIYIIMYITSSYDSRFVFPVSMILSGWCASVIISFGILYTRDFKSYRVQWSQMFQRSCDQMHFRFVRIRLLPVPLTAWSLLSRVLPFPVTTCLIHYHSNLQLKPEFF